MFRYPSIYSFSFHNSSICSFFYRSSIYSFSFRYSSIYFHFFRYSSIYSLFFRYSSIHSHFFRYSSIYSSFFRYSFIAFSSQVNNNSFSTALTSRRPITLDDIEPSHREDVWRLLGLLPGGDRGVKKVDPLQHKGPSRTNNGQASTGLGATKSLEGGAASTRARGGLMRDMSVDLTRDSSPVSSLTSTPLKQDALKEAQGKEEEGGGAVGPTGACPAASLTPLEGSAVSNHKHGVRRHHQLVSYTSLPFDGAGGGRLGGGIGSLALDPTFSPASLLCVPVACPGKETLAVLACLVDKTSEMEFDQEDVLTVQECFK